MDVSLLLLTIIYSMQLPNSKNCDEYLFESPNELYDFLGSNGGQLGSVTCLKVGLKENINTWILYSNNGLGVEECFFELKDSITSLPSSMDMPFLEKFDISLLGLTDLPNFLIQCKRLEYLDISFNRLNIPKAVDCISRIKQLKRLNIYGYDIPAKQIEKLRKHNSKLDIYYTKHQYLSDNRSLD